jgi:hypothetical protein
MSSGSGIINTGSHGKSSHQLQGSGNGFRSVNIIKLPGSLQNVPKSLLLEGEVVRQNSDGSVRIATAEGDIDVKLRGNRVIGNGERVEINISSGKPPREAGVKQADSSVPREASSKTGDPGTSNSGSQERVASEKPQVNVRVNIPPTVQAKAQEASAQQSSANVKLQAGNVVRMAPVTPAQAQQISQQTLAQMESSVFKMNLPQSFTTNTSQGSVNQNSLLAYPLQSLPNIPVMSGFGNLSSFDSSIASLLGFSKGAVLQSFSLSGSQGQAQGFGQSMGQASLGKVGEGFLLPSISNPGMGLINEGNPLQASMTSKMSSIDAMTLRILQPQINLTEIGGNNNFAGQLKLQNAIAGLNNAGSVTAQVTGFTLNNFPVLSMMLPGSQSVQNFVMQFNAGNLQVGSQIQIIPVGSSLSSVVTNVSGSSSMAILPTISQSWGWPAMDEIMQTIAVNNPEAARSLARVIPTPTNALQLGSSVMFFIAAARSGDIGSWLGERNLNILRRAAGGSDLISRLSQDVSSINRIIGEPVSSEWRSMVFPMAWQNEVSRVVMHYRNNQEDGDKGDNSGELQTRFIFDLNLSNMGDVQIDGLMRGKRLDMVVRTQSPFSSPVQQVLKQIYVRALDDTGVYGDLGFQGDPKQWVNITAEERNVGVEV